MSTDQSIEQEIRAKGANVGPRITPADIEANIASEHYFTADDGRQGAAYRENGIFDPGKIEPLYLLTFCVLVLKNGFTVTGESACASPENFDADIGRKVARANAVNKIWPLMGYELKTKLTQESATQKKYSHSDVAQCQVESDPIRFRFLYSVVMKDGRKFLGSVDAPPHENTELTDLILGDCNLQASS
jgi:hypothetical protein